MSTISESDLKASFADEGGAPKLADWLQTVSINVEDDMIDGGCDEPTIDVRLRFHDGSWSSYHGDASYDQDHRGHWGCSCVGQKLDREESLSIAADLYDQVAESLAMAGELA